MDRVALIIPLYTLNIVIVAWQILTQVTITFKERTVPAIVSVDVKLKYVPGLWYKLDSEGGSTFLLCRHSE